jgi:hypothetical protein
MNKIELNKTYDFEIKNVAFGPIPTSRLLELYKDGRVAAIMVEEALTHWFSELTRIEGNKDHDHVDREGRKFDAKCFTKHGLNFRPSNQMGAGRKFNEAIAHQKASELIYTCCGITDFPRVRVKFVEGSNLVQQYPSCSIPKGQREVFFG